MSHWGSWLPTSTTLGLHAELQWIAHFREKPLVDAANWVPGTPRRRVEGVQSTLALFKGCCKKEECSRFLITSAVCCAVMTWDAGRQPLLDMLSTTHERNPTFPCGSFYMNKTCTTGLIAATCLALKNFFLCLLPRRMSSRTFCKRTSTWVFSCTTAATRLLDMSR